MNLNADHAMSMAACGARYASAGAGWGHRNTYEIVCLRRDGSVKWRESIENLMTDEGLDHVLSNYWKGAAYTAAFYVGLISGTPTVAGADTMSSHSGWTEVVPYSQATRPALSLGTVSGGVVGNGAVPATYGINATATVGGAFIATNDTKSGTTGTLVAAGAFSGGNKAVESGETLDVVVTLTAANAA